MSGNKAQSFCREDVYRYLQQFRDQITVQVWFKKHLLLYPIQIALNRGRCEMKALRLVYTKRSYKR